MKNTITLLSLIAMLFNLAFAQKKELSLSDAVLKSWSTLAPEKLKKLDWLPKSNNYIYQGEKDDDMVYFIGNALSDKKEVFLTVYDLNGKLVNTLVDESFTSGSYNVVWNGDDFNGNKVAAGIYMYNLTSGENSITNKMVLIK